MSCLPLGECSRQLTTGAYENAQLSRGKNLHEGAASSLCAMHDPRMPASAHGMFMCVMWGYMCEWRGTTCVYVCHFLMHSIVCKGVNEFCLYVSLYVCLCYIYASIWAFSQCLFKWVWQKATGGSPGPTRPQQSVWCFFSDLVRCVNIHPLQSLAIGVWGNIELKHTFHMMAFVK